MKITIRDSSFFLCSNTGHYFGLEILTGCRPQASKISIQDYAWNSSEKIVLYFPRQNTGRWGIPCRWDSVNIDCIPCREIRARNWGCPCYDTKLHLMVRLKFWRYGDYKIPLHYHYFQVHSEPWVVVPVRIPSMCQIDMF